MATKKELIAQRNKLIKELEFVKLEILDLEEDISEKKKKRRT